MEKVRQVSDVQDRVLHAPDEKEGKLSGKVGVTVEKANHMGVTFEVEAADESNRKDSSVKYGVRFNYKF